MANMKVTYMNKNSGHGNMADNHTFIRCPKCKGKFIKEKNKICPHCAGTGEGAEGTNPESQAIFKAAVEKEVAKRMVAETAAKIEAEVDAENAADEKDAQKDNSKSKK